MVYQFSKDQVGQSMESIVEKIASICKNDTVGKVMQLEFLKSFILGAVISIISISETYDENDFTEIFNYEYFYADLNNNFHWIYGNMIS